MSSDADRLNQLQAEFEAVLEARITTLLAHTKAAQEVTARIGATQAEIRRQEALKERLEKDLAPLTKTGKALEAAAAKLQKRIDGLKANVSKMRGQRTKLVEQARGLAKEAKAAGDGK